MEEETTYTQGVSDGRVLQRLSEHDKHFAEINGSVLSTAERLEGVEKVLDRILRVLVEAGVTAGNTEARHRETVRVDDSEKWARIAALVGFAILALIVILSVVVLVFI